jgi:hypothetical protein
LQLRAAVTAACTYDSTRDDQAGLFDTQDVGDGTYTATYTLQYGGPAVIRVMFGELGADYYPSPDTFPAIASGLADEHIYLPRDYTVFAQIAVTAVEPETGWVTGGTDVVVSMENWHVWPQAGPPQVPSDAHHSLSIFHGDEVPSGTKFANPALSCRGWRRSSSAASASSSRPPSTTRRGRCAARPRRLRSRATSPSTVRAHLERLSARHVSHR